MGAGKDVAVAGSGRQGKTEGLTKKELGEWRAAERKCLD